MQIFVPLSKYWLKLLRKYGPGKLGKFTTYPLGVLFGMVKVNCTMSVWKKYKQGVGKMSHHLTYSPKRIPNQYWQTRLEPIPIFWTYTIISPSMPWECPDIYTMSSQDQHCSSLLRDLRYSCKRRSTSCHQLFILVEWCEVHVLQGGPSYYLRRNRPSTQQSQSRCRRW